MSSVGLAVAETHAFSHEPEPSGCDMNMEFFIHSEATIGEKCYQHWPALRSLHAPFASRLSLADVPTRLPYFLAHPRAALSTQRAILKENPMFPRILWIKRMAIGPYMEFTAARAWGSRRTPWCDSRCRRFRLSRPFTSSCFSRRRPHCQDPLR